MPGIMSGDMEKYIDTKKIFINSIGSKIKNKLRVRFHMDDKGDEIKKKLESQAQFII